MRYLLAVLTLCLFACASTEKDSRATPPAADRAAQILTEPSAPSQHLGRIYTVGDLGRLGPLTEVVIRRDLNAGWAEANGAGELSPAELERLLARAEPVAPGDPLIDGWHYAPWCSANFLAGGRRWRLHLYLGGLGLLADDADRKGIFRFDPRG